MASQVNDQNNTNITRTFNEICLCHLSNYQGGRHIMDLWMGQLAKRSKVIEILITYVVINIVENGG